MAQPVAENAMQQGRGSPPGGGRPGSGYGGGRDFGGGRSGGGSPVIPQLLRDTKTVEYFGAKSNDGRRSPRAALFDAEAEETAKKLAGIPASQLRRFFGAVMAIRRRLDRDSSLGAEFIQAEMALLKARAAYTLARRKKRNDQSELDDELLAFFVRHARSVDDRASFAAFMRHFEAVMAFHKVYDNN
jgi:CRISPR-associated protein Csm2